MFDYYCRLWFFSLSGRLAATGSADYSIKILDVERMMSKTALGHNQDLHPVIRTLYDHSDVSCVYTSSISLVLQLHSHTALVNPTKLST